MNLSEHSQNVSDLIENLSDFTLSYVFVPFQYMYYNRNIRETQVLSALSSAERAHRHMKNEAKPMKTKDITPENN